MVSNPNPPASMCWDRVHGLAVEANEGSFWKSYKENQYDPRLLRDGADMMKIVEKTKLVDVPEKGQSIFEELKTKYSGQLLWHWAVYKNTWLSNFSDNTLLNFNPPKAINGEIQGFFIPHNGKIALLMEWKEPKNDQ